MPEAVLSASVVSSAAEIPAEVWNSLAPNHDGVVDNPFVDHAFFLAAEQSGSATRRTGWQPQHLLLTDPAGDAVGVMPLFLKSHSQGEYVFDHGWADAFQRAGGDYYPTALWKPGEVILDRHALALPAGAQPARLLVGMYSGPDAALLAPPLELTLE